MLSPKDITGQVRHLRKKKSLSKPKKQPSSPLSSSSLKERPLRRDLFAMFVYTLVIATLVSQLSLILLMELV